MPLPIQNLSDIYKSQGMENPQLTYDDSGNPVYQATQVADKVDIDALAKKYSTGETNKVETPSKDSPDVAALAAKYNTVTNAKEAAATPGPASSLVSGIGQGIKDVGFTAGQALLKDSPEYSAKLDQFTKSQNEQFQQEQGDSTAASIGRVGGQALATAPLLPAKALQGINIGSKALPPIVNKLGTAVARGGVAGATFGAATNASNEEGLPSNVASGTVAGAVGGPIVERTAAVLSKIVPAAQQLWAKFGPIQQMANQSGAPASAIKNTIQVLENAGFTPATAQAALKKMGPKATIADLDPSLTTELSGIASIGGKPTAIAKGRMADRAETADSSAKAIVTNELGPKPDIEAEKQAIYKQASKDVGPLYKTAYKSGDKLDIKDLVSDIRDKLKTAVGEKEKALKTIGSYFLRKDAEGKFTNELKDTIPELHEVREGIDAILESKNPTTSIGNKAKSVLSDARKRVDEELKTNPEMKAADEKFAERIKVKQNLDYDWTKSNKEEFQNKFVNSTADEQAAIRKKMLADIHDTMEQASRGELAGAQQQFGKKSVNRAKLQIAFGAKADKVLDALANEGSMRATEKAIASGSQTAERSAIQRKYGEAPAPGYGHAIATGLPFDLIGGHGAAAVFMAGKKYVGGKIINFSENRLGALREGTADILSRQGLGRDTALSAMSKVGVIQNSIRSRATKQVKLPVVAAPIVGQAGYEGYRKLTGQR